MSTYEGKSSSSHDRMRNVRARPKLLHPPVEHGTEDPAANTSPPRSRRPDTSSFFSTLDEISAGSDQRNRPHAVPTPTDVSTAFFQLAQVFREMRRHADELDEQDETDSGMAHDLLESMIENLVNGGEMPPREVEGVSDEFCDSEYHSGPPVVVLQLTRRIIPLVLDRVPKSALKPDQICPICNNPFLDDEYPLVVRLPCHPDHIFDLECVRPWLRLRGTCPLDRFDFAQQHRDRAQVREQLVAEDDEEEWDGMYG
ncbi:hypothetical protein N7532_008694 [Penicillium argentinense]|uniref:RING-type domain-containing protein n=1 Tax=Penicillium argentinense TaxID=1131581 RepID=A0A9W9EY54_9EURO|nr:uncharacterized protein N7532_008694 [Penicillium argentinense]KAJ5090010.1 hypothetical protein N7532_008694 [Penicillium argentinense]